MRLGVWIIYILFEYCRLVKKSYVKNLGMGEWAPLPPCRSSATPSRLLHPYAIHTPGGGYQRVPAIKCASYCVPVTCKRWLCVCLADVLALCCVPELMTRRSVIVNDQRVSKKSPEGGPITLSFSIVCAYAVSYVCLCVVSYWLMTHWLRASLYLCAFWLV